MLLISFVQFFSFVNFKSFNFSTLYKKWDTEGVQRNFLYKRVYHLNICDEKFWGLQGENLRLIYFFKFGIMWVKIDKVISISGFMINYEL